MPKRVVRSGGARGVGEPVVPLEDARELLIPGKRVAKQTIFALGAVGEITVRLIGGRFVVTDRSLRAYRARHTESDQAA